MRRRALRAAHGSNVSGPCKRMPTRTRNLDPARKPNSIRTAVRIYDYVRLELIKQSHPHHRSHPVLRSTSAPGHTPRRPQARSGRISQNMVNAALAAMRTDCSNYDADCHRSAPFLPSAKRAAALALSVVPAARYRTARPIARACQWPQVLWLSPAALPAAPTRRAVRAKPNLPALPGGRPQRAQARDPPRRAGEPGHQSWSRPGRCPLVAGFCP
jgi:hypothetical protein